MRQLGRLTVAAWCVVLMGCSGGAAASPTPAGGGGGGGTGLSADQLCALLTPQEITTATTITVGAGVPEGVNAPSCTWTGDGGAVTLAWLGPSLMGKIAPGEQGNSAITLVPLSGVGDAADYTVNGTIQAALDFQKGSKALTVSLAYSPPAALSQIEGAERALALDALGRM